MGLTDSRQTAKTLTVNQHKRAIFTVNLQKSSYCEQPEGFKVFQISLFQLLISDRRRRTKQFSSSRSIMRLSPNSHIQYVAYMLLS